MTRTVKLCIFFSWFALSSFGQKELPVHTWFETQTFEEKQVFRAWCQNNSSSPLHLKYHAELVFNGKKLIKKGALLASPLQPILLSKAVFIIPANEFDTVNLLLYHRKKLISQTQYLRNQGEIKKSIATEEPPLPTGTPNTPIKKEATKTSVPNAVPSAFDAEIDGLVIDETRSKLAHDFYELFYNYWSAENISTSGHILTIREMPARIGIGSQVVVEVDGKRLTTLNLQPRGEVVENLAKQLTSALVSHFQDPANFMNIDSDDLNGSGMY